MIVINAITLIVGTSSASYLSFLYGALFFLSISGGKLKIRNVAIVFLIAYIFYPYLESSLSQYVYYGHSQTAIENASGRYAVWDMFINKWEKSPWLGYGYIIGERSFALLTNTDKIVFSAHNGYLSVLIGTGIIGMIPFASYIILTIYKNFLYSISAEQTEEYAILSSAIIMLLLNNISYPALGSDWNFTFPPIMAVLCLIHQLKYKTEDLLID